MSNEIDNNTRTGCHWVSLGAKRCQFTSSDAPIIPKFYRYITEVARNCVHHLFNTQTLRRINTYFSFKVLFLKPQRDLSNSVKVFSVLNFISLLLFYKKIQGSAVPRSADPQFSNTPRTLRYQQDRQSDIIEYHILNCYLHLQPFLGTSKLSKF